MLVIIISIVFVCSVVYIYKNNPYKYWQRENVSHLPPKFPLGCLAETLSKKRSLGTIITDIYMSTKEKIYGIHFLFKPVLMVRDVDTARQILISDFKYFYDRGVDLDGEDLFSLRGHDWKTLRTKMMPTFSTGKLKVMFESVDNIGDKMVQHLNSILANEPQARVDIKSILTTYGVDIIGSVIFGLDINSFADPTNDFRLISSNIFQRDDLLSNLNLAASFVYPNFNRITRKLGFKDPIIESLKNIVKNTVKYREKHMIYRKDLLQLLIELRNTGEIKTEDNNKWHTNTTPIANNPQMTLDALASQAFLFYIAGSETTSTTASFTLYELSMYPEILRKAQTEVMHILQRRGITAAGKLNYEAVQDMKFLDLCIMETLRKYPGLPFLSRECTETYQIPGMNYIIKKGTSVIVPIMGIQRDPAHFENPDDYDPERYLPENCNYNPSAYMPFGEGPRHCIALRMGKLNAKIALVKILANFNIEPQERKELQFIYDPAPVFIPKDGLYIHMSKKHP